MKKQMYGIIGLGCAAVVLGGGLAVLKLTDKSGNDSKGSSVVEETTLAYGSGYMVIDDSDAPYLAADEGTPKGKVKSVKVTGSGDTVLDAVIAKAATDESPAEYTLAGYEDLDVESLLVSTLFNNAQGLTSNSIVEENCTDFDKFGLADSAIKAEITFDSGKTRTLYIGDTSPVSSDTYVRVDDSSTVYTVTSSKMSNFRENPDYFIDKTITAKLDSESGVRIDSLEIEREDLADGFRLIWNKELELHSGSGSSASYIIEKPIEAYMKSEDVETVVTNFFGLYANSIKALHCTEKDIAECRLDAPTCKATAVCTDGSSTVLLMSEPFYSEDGTESCYVMTEGGNVIYIASTERALWVNLKPSDVLSSNIFVSRVWNVEKFEAKTESKSLSFDIQPNSSDADRTTVKKEEMNVKLNGTPYDTERFRQFYSYAVSMPAEEMAYTEPVPSGSPMATITYSDAVLEKSGTFEFYDYSATKCLIVINGESRYICTKAYVTTLIDNMTRVETGEEYVKTWKH